MLEVGMVQAVINAAAAIRDAGYNVPDDLSAQIEALKTEAFYNHALRQYVTASYNGKLSVGDFIDKFARLIDEQFSRAWREGMRSVGVDPESMSDEELDALAQAIRDEEGFVLDYISDIDEARIMGKPLAPLLARVDLWAKRYPQIVTQAALMAKANQPMEWVLGVTEQHCESCLKLNGIVKRAKFWQSSGVMPQNAPNPNLECGGWRCDCRLEPTDKPVKKGPLPRLP